MFLRARPMSRLSVTRSSEFASTVAGVAIRFFYLVLLMRVTSSLLQAASDQRPGRPVPVVSNLVACQGTRVCAAVVSNGKAGVRGDHVDVEVHEPLAKGIGAARPNPMRSVTSRTTEAIVDVGGVLGKAGVLHDVRQVVALPAQRIGAVHTEVRVREKVADQGSRCNRLAELIPTFQDVGPLRSMRPVWPGASKLAIVVTIVAVGAEDLTTYRAPLGGAV